MRFDAEFLQMFLILGRFEAPILRGVGTDRSKKMCSKKECKESEKRGAREAQGKPKIGGWPFKTKETGHQIIIIFPRHRLKHAPADIKVYQIYLEIVQYIMCKDL